MTTKHEESAEELAEAKRSRRSGAWLRLGAVCLVALTFLALFLVGGSLSKITSSGDVSSGSFSLHVAEFGDDCIEVAESEDTQPGEIYGDDNNQVVLYAFDVTNNTDVDITFDMVIDIQTIKFEVGLNSTVNIKFILFDPINDKNYIELTDEIGMDVGNFTMGDIDYSTEEGGGAFFLSREQKEVTVVLAMECNVDGYSNDEITVTVTGQINITAVNQAKEDSTTE